MPATNDEAQQQLRNMPEQGLAAAQDLFWRVLGYSRVNTLLGRHDWAPEVQVTLAEAPTLLAKAGDGFHVIYCRLAQGQTGRGSPFSLASERQVVNRLLPEHPHALFLFSDYDPHHWHFVNAREGSRDVLDAWYRRQAQQVFAERLEACFPKMRHTGAAMPELAIRVMRTRWGTTSPSGRLTLNQAGADAQGTDRLCRLSRAVPPRGAASRSGLLCAPESGAPGLA
jgi:hypothetical protein